MPENKRETAATQRKNRAAVLREIACLRKWRGEGGVRMAFPPETRPRSRREFLALCAGALAAAGWPHQARAATTDLHLGLCGSPADGGIARQAGLRFIEFSANGNEVIRKSEEEFVSWIRDGVESDVPLTCANGFFPAEIKLLGPDRDLHAVRSYVEALFRRFQQAKVDFITLGSGASRSIPEGYDAGRARSEFVETAREIATIAQDRGVTVGLEPLNRSECNFLNRLSEARDIAIEIDRPAMALTADVYHMLREDEGPESIVEAGALVRHCHIAEKAERTAPGVAGDDFAPYFAALRSIGYRDRVSLECRWTDLADELPKAVATLTRQWNQAFSD